MMKREQLSSRMGFILLAAGCAVGLGNVWRFPFIAGQYGGALFVIIYLLFLVIFGIPVMAMEFAVGRGSGKSAARSFHELQPKGSKWHLFSWAAMGGNYLLMMFYTTVSGWMLAYTVRMARGDFYGLSPAEVGTAFGEHTGNPVTLIGWMVVVCILGFGICAGGLVKSVEKITKIMMYGLLVLLVLLVVRSVTLEGASAGLAFFLMPNPAAIQEHGLFTIIFAALGQAFFTLSLGIGAMAIFGSYINRERRLFGEAITVTVLDASVALLAGLAIFPAVFAFQGEPAAGPGLIFVTLPNIFNHMPLGRFWGTLFFLFMSFAAMATVVAVFENITSFAMDITGCSRRKSSFLNLAAVTVLSVPSALGFNVLSRIQPLGTGTNIQSLLDFIVSNNLLPLGGLVYVLFCVSKMGWGWDNFIKEADTGKGPRFPAVLRLYITWAVPIVILVIFVFGYINRFAR